MKTSFHRLSSLRPFRSNVLIFRLLRICQHFFDQILLVLANGTKRYPILRLRFAEPALGLL